MIYDVNGNPIDAASYFGGLPHSPVLGQSFLIRHRAGNSHNAFATAYNNNYVAVEGDVRFTSDSVPVMCHDATMWGLTIASSTLAQLQNAGTVYTLEDWLLECKKYHIFADIDFTKTYTEPQCAILVETLENCGMTGQASIECGITTAKTRLVALSDKLILNVLGANSAEALEAFADIENYCRGIIGTIHRDLVTSTVVELVHSKGYTAKVWVDSDTLSDVTGLLDIGVDQIIVDNTKPSQITL
jgi:glycerophosphoryl diester phosphodiesterase